LKADPKARFNARQAAILSGMYKGTPLAAATADGLALPATISDDLRNEMIKASRGAPSARGFATETQRIATLMRDRYRLGFVDIDEWDNTTVVVLSEFGRTFRENGDKGTDHGHGTVHWVLGGKVNGGRIAGEQ